MIGTYTRTHSGDIHTEAHIRRGHAHKESNIGTYAQRDIHTEGHTHGAVYTPSADPPRACLHRV